MNHFRILIVLFFAATAGCSQYIKDTGATIKEAYSGLPDTHMTKDEVEALPYASIYARVNNGPRVFMVLAFAEINTDTGNTRLKWLSSDGAMIVTENGRVVKTLHLPNYNLLNVTTSESYYQPKAESDSWKISYDWQPGYHLQQEASVQSSVVGKEFLTSLIWQKNTKKVTEIITPDQNNQSYQNTFWVDEQGKVVKSIQWAIPEHLMIELEILKPYIG